MSLLKKKSASVGHGIRIISAGPDYFSDDFFLIKVKLRCTFKLKYKSTDNRFCINKMVMNHICFKYFYLMMFH